MAIETDMFLQGIMYLSLIPITLITGLVGIKIYSWGRAIILEKELSQTVQTED